MPKKLYKTEQSILKDIDKSRRRMAKLRNDANTEDVVADIKFKSEDAQELIEAQQHRDTASLMRAQAERIESTRLVKLGRALSAFRTNLKVPGFEEAQVVLEKL